MFNFSDTYGHNVPCMLADLPMKTAPHTVPVVTFQSTPGEVWNSGSDYASLSEVGALLRSQLN